MEPGATKTSRNSVILTTLLAFGIFWLAGTEAQRKTRNALRRISGKGTVDTGGKSSGPDMTVSVAFGWAVIFLTLIILTDIDATQELGVAFGWLFFISVAIAYGADAFGNVTTVLNMNGGA